MSDRGYYQPHTDACAAGLQGPGRPISRAKTMAQAEQQRDNDLRGPGRGEDAPLLHPDPASGSGGAITDAPTMTSMLAELIQAEFRRQRDEIARLTRERDGAETKLRVALENLHAAGALIRAAEGERDAARAALQTAYDWLVGGVEYDAAQEAHWEARARRALGEEAS